MVEGTSLGRFDGSDYGGKRRREFLALILIFIIAASAIGIASQSRQQKYDTSTAAPCSAGYFTTGAQETNGTLVLVCGQVATDIYYPWDDGVVGSLNGYYMFDEGTGTSAYDASGSGNTGTLVSSPPWLTGSNCAFYKCIQTEIAGSGATLRYVNLGAVLSSDSFSIAFWFYEVNHPSAISSILNSKDTTCIGTAPGIYEQTSGALTLTRCNVTDDYTTATIATGGWHFLVVTHTAAGKPIIYLDGGTGAQSANAITYSGFGNWYLGAGPNQSNKLINFDSVRFYSNVQLSQAQITYMYQYEVAHHNV